MYFNRSRASIIIQNIKKYGMIFKLKQVLSYFGIKTYIKTMNPYLEKILYVRTDTVWKLIEKKEWENLALTYIQDVVKPGDIVFDIGAWKGTYSLLFSYLVSESGRVYSFDPDPIAFQGLMDNINKNLIKNVIINKLCISNKNGNISLISRSLGDSESSIYLEKKKGFTEIIVNATTLDAFCSMNNIQPTGIKIDVEGAEGMVLEGAENTLLKYHPWVLLEFHSLLIKNEDRKRIWETVTKNAKKIVFIDGINSSLQKTTQLDPPNDNCHIFIQY